jgi:hypothetical protein
MDPGLLQTTLGAAPEGFRQDVARFWALGMFYPGSR